MCQRKIIGKNLFRVVPSSKKNCPCPNIISILDMDKARLPTVINTDRCLDVQTQLYLYDEFESRIPVFFRICACLKDHLDDLCKVLPPMHLEPDDEEEDDDDWDAGGLLRRL